VDNLSGISDAIEAVFPQAEIRKCIVHQIRRFAALRALERVEGGSGPEENLHYLKRGGRQASLGTILRGMKQ
jgi:hypothetical protein